METSSFGFSRQMMIWHELHFMLPDQQNWMISRYLAKINVLIEKKKKTKRKVLKKLLTKAVKIKSRQKPTKKRPSSLHNIKQKRNWAFFFLLIQYLHQSAVMGKPVSQKSLKEEEKKKGLHSFPISDEQKPWKASS